jgi:hypothetical protein
MTPAELDILLNGAFIYERPDGSRYAAWSSLGKFGVDHVGRSGALSQADIQRPASEVLADINSGLAA